MKKIFILSITVLLCSQIKAQDILDTSYFECTYTFTQMTDTVTQKKSIRDRDMRLLIGKTYSKFYSQKLQNLDSILNSMTEAERISMLSGGNFIDLIKKYSSTEAYKVYTNHKEHQITVTDFQPPSRVLYSEPLPNQNWKILSDTKDFNGYKCQKATSSFRGRDYVAWFTNEIPVKEGPWKFNGLPGLIVKVYDTQEHYDFELTSVRKINQQITFNGQDYNKVSLKDHIKICRYRIQNPLANLMSRSKNVRTTLNPDPKPYDVMERDIK
jgi:GLPGLI family protein